MKRREIFRRLRRSALLAVVVSAPLFSGPIAFAADQDASDPIVDIATLEWPPYTGSTLPGYGPVSATISDGLAHIGLVARVHVVPWKRAIARAKSPDSAVVGYFPGYHCRHQPGFVASLPIGVGPVGLAERADDDVRWSNLDDLSSVRVGVVTGYANSDEFDTRVAEGRIPVSEANTDADNLRQLSDGAVDLAVIDANVFDWLMADPEIAAKMSSSLRMDDHLLDERPLFLCFVDTVRGRALKDRFNDAVQVLDLPRVFVKRFQRMLEKQ